MTWEEKGLLEFLFKVLLTFNSTSFILIIYLIKENCYIWGVEDLPIWVSHIIFMVVPIVCTAFSIVLKRILSKDSIECMIKDVKLANNEFLPSYLGYFFVGLSVPNVETMTFVYVILFIFTFVSQTLYFNPLFLCFGYHFYYITTMDNVTHFIISKKYIRASKNLKFSNLRRINYFSYIDAEEKKR